MVRTYIDNDINMTNRVLKLIKSLMLSGVLVLVSGIVLQEETGHLHSYSVRIPVNTGVHSVLSVF